MLTISNLFIAMTLSTGVQSDQDIYNLKYCGRIPKVAIGKLSKKKLSETHIDLDLRDQYGKPLRVYISSVCGPKEQQKRDANQAAINSIDKEGNRFRCYDRQTHALKKDEHVLFAGLSPSGLSYRLVTKDGVSEYLRKRDEICEVTEKQ